MLELFTISNRGGMPVLSFKGSRSDILLPSESPTELSIVLGNLLPCLLWDGCPSCPVQSNLMLCSTLTSGEMRPPLTVVLINNGGGGIFSFLPIAGAVPDDVFTPLWATPQHVDLAGTWVLVCVAGVH